MKEGVSLTQADPSEAEKNVREKLQELVDAINPQTRCALAVLVNDKEDPEDDTVEITRIMIGDLSDIKNMTIEILEGMAALQKQMANEGQTKENTH